MSKTFHYIQNDDVLKYYMEYRDSLLSERPVVIARHGDYSLFLKVVSRENLGLDIQNTAKNKSVEFRTYDVKETTKELVSRGTRHAIQKMAELSDEETNRKRLQIWKWYIMDWQKANKDTTEELMNKELSWNEEKNETDEILDMESFLHGDYLNIGNTIALIDRYLHNEQYKERFKKFAIDDIMEMTREDTKDRSLEEAELLNQTGGLKKHTYQFTVSVEATDREHARAALLNYLAGDDRIKIQK